MKQGWRPRRQSYSMGTGVSTPLYAIPDNEAVDFQQEQRLMKKHYARRGSMPAQSLDFGTYDVPLIASLPETMAEQNEQARPRSTSASSSFKGLLNTKSKNRNKSVDREEKKEKEKDKDKKKGFFENFRPRAKSDVSGLKRPARSPLPTEHSMDESTLMAQANFRPVMGSQEAITPMGQILEGQMLNLPEEDRSRHKSGPSGYREGGFRSMIRTLSSTESKPPKSPKRPVQSQRSLSPPSSPRADRSHLSPLKFQSGEPRSAPPGIRGSAFSEHTHASYRQDLINRVLTESADRMEVEDLPESRDQTYSKFMKTHRCYDIIPTSAKLVVFDTNLNVKKAFFALIYNGVRAAPLWDTNRQDFVGMLTITDFISILRRLYVSPNVRMDELEDHKILNWREMETDRQRPFMYITPDASLFDAIKSLLENHVHRLPVMDEVTGNALYILTHKRILRFLHMFIRSLAEPPFMRSTVRELGIGTYTNVITATPETTILTALNLFMDHRVSALPVVNSAGEIINIYAKFDVITLAADKSYNNLDITLEEALKRESSEGTEKVATCLPSNTLSAVIEKIVTAEVHRLVIVDEENHVLGILSLSDILRYIILRPVEVVPSGAAEQAQRENQPPQDEESAIAEALLSEPEVMGAEAAEGSQASS